MNVGTRYEYRRMQFQDQFCNQELLDSLSADGWHIIAIHEMSRISHYCIVLERMVDEGSGGISTLCTHLVDLVDVMRDILDKLEDIREILGP